MTQQALEFGEPVDIAVIGRDSRRFNCMLILWMTVLTVGLVADLSLHFILRPLPPSEAPGPTTAAPGQSEGMRGFPKSIQQSFFDLVPQVPNAPGPGPILWRNYEERLKDESLHIKADGFYFLYGQVTLTSVSSSHTVKVIKKHQNEEDIVLELSFDERSNSTGFFGKILRLEATSSIIINCTNRALIKSGSNRNLLTFAGIYKLGNF